jgi:hypothetical protein
VHFVSVCGLTFELRGRPVRDDDPAANG